MEDSNYSDTGTLPRGEIRMTNRIVTRATRGDDWVDRSIIKPVLRRSGYGIKDWDPNKSSSEDDSTDGDQPKKRKYSGPSEHERKKRSKRLSNHEQAENSAQDMPSSLLQEKKTAIEKHGGYLSTDYKWAFGDFRYKLKSQDWKEEMFKYSQYPTESMQGVWLMEDIRNIKPKIAWYWGLDSVGDLDDLIQKIGPTVSQALINRDGALNGAGKDCWNHDFKDDLIFTLMEYVTVDMLNQESLTISDSMLACKYISEHISEHWQVNAMTVPIELEFLVQVAKLIRAYPHNFRGFCPVRHKLGLEFSEDWNRAYYAFKYYCGGWSKMSGKKRRRAGKKQQQSLTPAEPVQWMPIPAPSKSIQVETQVAERARSLSSGHLKHHDTRTQYSANSPFLQSISHPHSPASPHGRSSFPKSPPQQTWPPQHKTSQQEEVEDMNTGDLSLPRVNANNQTNNQIPGEEHASYAPRVIELTEEKPLRGDIDSSCILACSSIIECLEKYIRAEMPTLETVLGLTRRATQKLGRLVAIQRQSHNLTCMSLFSVIISQIVKFLEIGCSEFFTGIESKQDLRPQPKLLRSTLNFGDILDDMDEQLIAQSRLAHRAIMGAIEVFYKVKALSAESEAGRGNRQGTTAGLSGLFVDLEARLKKLGMQMGRSGNIANAAEYVHARF